jgi:hypothetical protein
MTSLGADELGGGGDDGSVAWASERSARTATTCTD